MLNTPTLFIVGAGASAELGFPVGTELRDRISAILNIKFHGAEFSGPDQDFADYLAGWVFRPANSIRASSHDVWNAATSVSRAIPLSGSVDSYLDSHLGHPLRTFCAKAAICRLISQSENSSPLICDNSRDALTYDFGLLKDTWYQRLWNILQTGISSENRDSIFYNLRIVTFNYDRNIERFLQFAYAIFFDVPLEEADRKVREIGILHVYGSLGDLDWNPDTSPSFRTNGYTIDIDKASSLISTYTEKVNSVTTDVIGQYIRGCQRMIFLGFSFGIANVNLIRSAVDNLQIQREVFATSYRMSPEANQHARSIVDSLFSGNVSAANFRDDTAVQLFDRYSGVF